MASRKSSAGPTAQERLIMELMEKLYDQCSQEDHSQVFRQEDLFEMDVIPDRNIQVLMQVAQRLCDEKLFKLIVAGGAAGWMYRSRDDAAKYLSLTHEQEMVYSLIDESGAEGIWSKTIKTRTNMHDSTMRGVIKALETKRLISDMKSVEHLSRKMYIKTSLTPSEKATGGPWYTDGELDEAFIQLITEALFKQIVIKSFYKPSAEKTKRSPKRSRTGAEKAATKMTAAEAKALRDAALQESAAGVAVQVKIEEEDFFKQRPNEFAGLLPWPATYQNYPTLDQLTLYIENNAFTEQTLTKVDIEQLLDVLCFDNRIEKIKTGSDTMAYKALRKTPEEIEGGPMNGLTEAPCGRCPVFDLCEEGGPVGPSNCEYFKRWLQLPGFEL